MLAKPDAEKDRTARIRKLAADLDDDDFDVREAATAALVKLGRLRSTSCEPSPPTVRATRSAFALG